MRKDTQGGSGGRNAPKPTARDVRLRSKALTKGWLLAPEKQEEVASLLCDAATDPATQLRYKIQAARALIHADLAQQRLDLDRERAEGVKSEVPLADLVAEAEKRAEERIRERERE